MLARYSLELHQELNKAETGPIGFNRKREYCYPLSLFVYSLNESIISTVDDVLCRMRIQPLFNNVTNIIFNQTITLRRREESHKLTNQKEGREKQMISNEVMYKSNLSLPTFNFLSISTLALIKEERK